MSVDETKTHWLQNPNKNYLGHYDLPNGKDMILTIKSAKWEEVKNPIINTSEAKRVVRFVEDVKPFICNEINAQSIMRSTGESYLQDAPGKKIKLFLSQVNVKGVEVDCLRVREAPQSELVIKYISDGEVNSLQGLLKAAGKNEEETCKIMQIESLDKFPAHKYEKMCKRLMELALTDGNN